MSISPSRPLLGTSATGASSSTTILSVPGRRHPMVTLSVPAIVSARFLNAEKSSNTLSRSGIRS
ncbi:MAG TPA: hypothetical protein VMJ30_09955 [Gemmatimonadales bacterium]|nr:hypothetical protein [Gemmatimonadales bacterium]